MGEKEFLGAGRHITNDARAGSAERGSFFARCRINESDTRSTSTAAFAAVVKKLQGAASQSR